MGSIKIRSDIVHFDPIVDYTMINTPKSLYDTYNLDLSDV
jgi:hypothetical protein